jgi:hypothetical protein
VFCTKDEAKFCATFHIAFWLPIWYIIYRKRKEDKMIKISDIWTWEEWLQAVYNQRKESENES